MATQTLSPVAPSISSDSLSSVDAHLKHIKKSYQADQQVKYLHLEAEIDVLLQQLQNLKQQKLRTTPTQAEEN